VDVQNRLSRATPRLPAAVNQQGVVVSKASNNFLLFALLSSDDPAFGPIEIGDYVARNVVPEIQRLAGVGQVQLFGTERAMRIWIDPAKLAGLQPVAGRRERRHRGAERAGGLGAIGDLPQVPRQTISATVVVAASWPRSKSSAHRAARQPRRLHRAPEGRGPHRAGRPAMPLRPGLTASRHRLGAAVAPATRWPRPPPCARRWPSWSATFPRA
jgi:hypothetical protein